MQAKLKTKRSWELIKTRKDVNKIKNFKNKRLTKSKVHCFKRSTKLRKFQLDWARKNRFKLTRSVIKMETFQPTLQK